jgi:dihydroxy-acid dehydratase
MAALREAGAMPQVFGTPDRHRWYRHGHGRNEVLVVSREVIADAIETSVNGQMMDGALVIGAC